MAQAHFDSWTPEPRPNVAIVEFDEADMVVVRRELAKDSAFLDKLINDAIRAAARFENEKKIREALAKAQGYGSFDQQVGVFRLA